MRTITLLLAGCLLLGSPLWGQGRLKEKLKEAQQENQILQDSMERLQAQLVAYRKVAEDSMGPVVPIFSAPDTMVLPEAVEHHLKGVLLSELKAPELAYTLERYDNEFDIYMVDIRERQLDLYWQGKNGKPLRSFRALKQELEAEGATLNFAMNAGMYTPEGSPQGLYIEEGSTLRPVDTVQEAYGNFYMQPNGVFYIDSMGRAGVSTTKAFDTLSAPMQYATQSGPMLVIDGQLHPVFTKGSSHLNIRNGVGVLDEHRLVFVISRRPVNLYDFASVFRDYFGCLNALYLDGAISRLYLPQLERHDLGGDFGPLIGVWR